jgi:hypothetical protein
MTEEHREMTEQRFVGGIFDGYRCLMRVPVELDLQDAMLQILIPRGMDPTTALCWGETRIRASRYPTPSDLQRFASYSNTEPGIWTFNPPTPEPAGPGPMWSR